MVKVKPETEMTKSSVSTEAATDPVIDIASTAEAEAEADAKAQADAVPVPQIFVRVIGPQQGRWRGGYGTPRHFTSDPVDIPFDDLSDEERAELQADPELKVAIIDLPH